MEKLSLELIEVENGYIVRATDYGRSTPFMTQTAVHDSNMGRKKPD